MYNLNELAFETMLEQVKQENKGNPFIESFIDKMSYEYHRQQYNECLQHIDEDNKIIANIYNQISHRGGFTTTYEQQELQRHIQLRSEYEEKSMKHLMSVAKDSISFQSDFKNILSK